MTEGDAPICGFCGESIPRRDLVPIVAGTPLHRECQFRLVVGSVAHIQRRCGCYVAGSTESDPPHMTPRQAATAAMALYRLMQVRN